MGFSKSNKAAVYVQPDLADGDHSVSELQARNTAQQEAANATCKATWNKPNTLTASEIATLDGKGGKSTERNAIGAPVSLVSKVPAGYKSAESKLQDENSKPTKR
jgi:hypothetical protein